MGGRRCVCLALALLLPALGGCAVPGAAASAGRSAAPAATGALAVVSASPSPASSPTAPPTAAASSSALPASPSADAGTALSYYVVEKGGRQGVVDSLGREVLPFSFALVQLVSNYTADENGVPCRTGLLAFYAVPSELRLDGWDGQETVGYLYGTDGRKLMQEPLSGAYAVDDSAIAVSGPSGEGAPSLQGLADYTGRLLLPMEFSSIFPFSGRYLAVKEEGGNGSRHTSVVCTAAGERIAQAEGFVQTVDGSLLLLYGQDDRCCVVDDHLRPLDDCRWQSVWLLGSNRYVVVAEDNRQCVIDRRGKVLMPLLSGSYEGYEKDGDGECYAVQYQAGGIALLDGDGKPLFHSDDYDRIRYEDGVLLAY